MRMKDSDDYLTARAANPYTGLISPSVGIPSPRTPCTPDSPAAALKLPVPLPVTPTPEPRNRPGLARANESRKVSAGSLNKWRADARGWISDTTLTVASPRQTPEIAEGALSTSMSQPSLLKDDQFIFNMPSAKEPQPFTYPGRSAAEIEAFEHYRRKTRKASGEGYDQRVLYAARIGSGGVRKTSAGSPCSHHSLPAVTTETTCQAHPNTHRAHPRAISLTQRPPHHYDPDLPAIPGAELSAANFAPFASPRTPASKPDLNPTLLKTVIQVPEVSSSPHDAALKKQQHMPDVAPARRKPLGSAPRLGGSAVTTATATTEDDRERERELLDANWERPKPKRERGGAADINDLSKLPKVRLMHPEHAGRPSSHAQRSAGNCVRKCSLGCQQRKETGECLKTKREAGGGVPEAPAALFESKARGFKIVPDLENLMFSFIGAVFNAGQSVRLPSASLLGALSSDTASAKQKVEALRALLLLSGQALVFLMVVTVVLRLGAAILHAVEVLLWPLVVPFRILKWIAKGG
ncbi:hypothetical protein B0A50_02282 [Salinomyces thailandicus]|uniref:Uncharacterized protein n=1 Tax=Salinomyces thailandicus TaxID=706561 RepID=A0A4U0UAY7_9PEZI|nr:hypothetical protein B0A50_02282 [Salinomyces thailandica]